VAGQKNGDRAMKIFGIGVARTGTTTLAKALEILGYKSVHVECNVMEISDDTFSINKDIIDNNEAIVGTPLSPCYKKLAKENPDSLFILTIRDSESWLNSCSLSFTEKLSMDENHQALHRWLYKSILFDRNKFISGYISYVVEVCHFFDAMKNRLLLYNICSVGKWDPLCEFLGKNKPDCPLPHESKRGALLS
jgi:hypothetical protein